MATNGCAVPVPTSSNGTPTRPRSPSSNGNGEPHPLPAPACFSHRSSLSSTTSYDDIADRDIEAEDIAEAACVAPPASTSFFTTPSGYSIYYELRGNPAAKQKVLLIIGYVGDTSYWGAQPSMIVDQAAQWDADVQTCVFDGRGCRRSSELLTAPYSTRGAAEDLFALLQHMHWIDRGVSVHVVGWSMGGMIAQELMLRVLEVQGSLLNFSSLTLCNTSSGGLTSMIRCMRGRRGMRYRLRQTLQKLFIPLKPRWLPSLDGLLRVLSIGLCIRKSSRIQEVLKLHFSPQFLSRDTEAVLATHYSTASPFDRAVPWYLPTMFGHTWMVAFHHVSSRRLELLRESGLRVLVIASKEDPVVPYEGSAYLQNALRCRLHCFFQTGHMAHLEHARTFAQLICAHILSLSSTSSASSSLSSLSSSSSLSSLVSSSPAITRSSSYAFFPPPTPSALPAEASSVRPSPKSSPATVRRGNTLRSRGGNCNVERGGDGEGDVCESKVEGSTGGSAGLSLDTESSTEETISLDTREWLDMSLWRHPGPLYRFVSAFIILFIIPASVVALCLALLCLPLVLMVVLCPPVLLVLVSGCAVLGASKFALRMTTDYQTERLFGFWKQTADRSSQETSNGIAHDT